MCNFANGVNFEEKIFGGYFIFTGTFFADREKTAKTFVPTR